MSPELEGGKRAVSLPGEDSTNEQSVLILPVVLDIVCVWQEDTAICTYM